MNQSVILLACFIPPFATSSISLIWQIGVGSVQLHSRFVAGILEVFVLGALITCAGLMR